MAFLTLDGAGYISGATIQVDGGKYMHERSPASTEPSDPYRPRNPTIRHDPAITKQGDEMSDTTPVRRASAGTT